MKNQISRGVKPVAWFFYLLIVFEIIYMVSPFAIYFYSSYGPVLNFLHQWPHTAWLTGFFLPHYTETSSWLLNNLGSAGQIIFLFGLLLFLSGAAQIYYAKLYKKRAVTKGLYRFIRHPQYTAFSIMGIGVLLVWPRFLVLMMYITMLFIYYLLARFEENECKKKFGETYSVYLNNTSMFVPGDSKIFNSPVFSMKSKVLKIISGLMFYIMFLSAVLAILFGIRDYSLEQIAAVYLKDEATISVVMIEESDLKKIRAIALNNPEVMQRLINAGYQSGSKFLNYILPESWYLADIPMEKRPAGIHGHYTPKEFNRKLYKVLFTRAKIYSNTSVVGSGIIKASYGREPIIVVRVDIGNGKVLSIDNPVSHVLWGDIPTPLF
jgi:protein-S-isoprenylcysteine O-methyltransferase Ste14